MQLRSLSSAIAATFLMTGCAVGPGNIKPDGEQASVDPIPEQAQVSGCLRTQRDLTVPWRLRRYWCGNDTRRDSLQAHNIRLLAADTDHNTDQGVVPSRTDATPVTTFSSSSQLPPRTASDTTPTVRLASAMVEPEMVRYLSVNHVADANLNTLNERTASTLRLSDQVELPQDAHVVFTRTREALDAEGIDQARSLIPAAQQARRVTLLGLYESDELTKVRPGPDPEERFSVGRSLSVRELWRSEGVDVSKVTILHHRENRPGQQVEVTFHD